jgi:hypothetical protein
MRWVVNVASVGKEKKAQRVLARDPAGKGPLGKLGE